jgi:cyanate permease
MQMLLEVRQMHCKECREQHVLGQLLLSCAEIHTRLLVACIMHVEEDQKRSPLLGTATVLFCFYGSCKHQPESRGIVWVVGAGVRAVGCCPMQARKAMGCRTHHGSSAATAGWQLQQLRRGWRVGS